MLSAIKFGTSQFLTSNPPANTVCLALDFDDRQLYMITSECKVLLSDLMTAHLLGEDGKIKAEYLNSGAVVEVPTKTSQLTNDSGFITKDSKNLTYYLTKDETLATIADNIKSVSEKIDQKIEDLQEQINGLVGSYVYIGKIDSENPSQEELTQAAIQFKGEAKIGYVIVDGSQREWYFDGSAWNDFGSASATLTWDAIQNKPNLVEYSEYPAQSKTASITLTNHNSLFGTDTAGSIYNLVMVSKWNKADFGSASIQMNLNSPNDVVTINDDKVIATVDQIPIIPDMSDVVKYQAIDGKTGVITLNNHQNLLGKGTDGSLYNLAMVSKWDKADFGSSGLECNFNAKDGKVTINDDKVVATVDVVNETATTIASETVKTAIGTDDDLALTLDAINALSTKIESI